MSVRRYATAPHRPRRSRRASWAIAAVVVVLGIGALIVVTPTRAPREASQPPEHRSSQPPSRSRVDRPIATRRGAVEAAVRAMYGLAVPALTDSNRFKRSLASMSATGREAAVRAAFGAANENLFAGGIVRTAPLGYRIEQFDGRAAAVSIWTVSLAAGPRAPTQASWRRLTFDLRWERGRWLVSGGAGGAAPSPSSSGDAAILEASTYAELKHVP